MGLGHAGARHDQVGAGHQLGQLLGAGSAHHGDAQGGETPRPLGEAGRAGLVVDHRDRAVGGQAPGHRLPRHPEPDDERVRPHQSMAPGMRMKSA